MDAESDVLVGLAGQLSYLAAYTHSLYQAEVSYLHIEDSEKQRSRRPLTTLIGSLPAISEKDAMMLIRVG